MAGALQWVQSVGLGRYANVVPGPLLRATDGKKVTHIQLQTGSAYGHLSKAMEKAYFTSRARGVVDQELDLGSHDPDKPKIGHHWARRKADQVARVLPGTRGTLRRTRRRRLTRHLDGTRTEAGDTRESNNSIMQAQRRY